MPPKYIFRKGDKKPKVENNIRPDESTIKKEAAVRSYSSK